MLTNLKFSWNLKNKMVLYKSTQIIKIKKSKNIINEKKSYFTSIYKKTKMFKCNNVKFYVFFFEVQGSWGSFEHKKLINLKKNWKFTNVELDKIICWNLFKITGTQTYIICNFETNQKIYKKSLV